MGKTLPALGLAASVLALCSAIVLGQGAVFVTRLFVAACAVVLLLQRSLAGLVGAVACLALAVLAFLALAGGINTENSGSADFGFSESMGKPLAVAAALAFVAAVAWCRWESAQPRWLALAGLAAAALAALLAFAFRDRLDDQQEPMALVTGLMAAASAMAPVAAWRGDEGAGPAGRAPPAGAPPLPPPRPSPGAPPGAAKAPAGAKAGGPQPPKPR